MMEPVAWRNEHGAVTNFKHGADAWRDAGIWSEPLVRLSDAEARIDRLTRELAEARDALLGSMGLIDRIMHVHVAPDECTSYVEGSRRWFSVNGGSLAAIAEQQAINRVALKEKP